MKHKIQATATTGSKPLCVDLVHNGDSSCWRDSGCTPMPDMQQPGSSGACFISGVVHAQGGKILACAACEDSQSVASASSSGSVHVWRVEYTSRSGGAPDRYTGIIGIPQPHVSLCHMHCTWSQCTCLRYLFCCTRLPSHRSLS